MMEGISARQPRFAGHLKLDKPLLNLRQPITSPSKARRISRSTEDVAGGFCIWDGTSFRVGGCQTIWIASRTRFGMPPRDDGQDPRSYSSDSHIRLWFAGIVKIPVPRMASRSAKTNQVGEAGYGWAARRQVLCSQRVYEHLQSGMDGGAAKRANSGGEALRRVRKQFPELPRNSIQIQKARTAGELVEGHSVFQLISKGVSGRDALPKSSNAIAPNLPWIIGVCRPHSVHGRRDLLFRSAGDFQADSRSGRNLHFGIR